MTDPLPLPLSRFAEMVEAYGAEPRRWPEEERDAALALLRVDPRAGALLDAGGSIDTLLGRHAVPPPSPALRAAVLADARLVPARHRLRRWWAAAALALAGGGGILAGSAAAAALAPDAGAISIWDRGDLTAFGDPLAEGG